MVVLPGVILLLCGGLTLLVTNSDSGSSGDWTSMTSLSITIVGAIISVAGFLYCTKMWCKYKPRKTKTPVGSKNEPVSLVAVYKIRQEGHDNPGFVSDAQGHGVNRARGQSGVVKQQPGGGEKEKLSREYSTEHETLHANDSVDFPSSSNDKDFDLEKGDLSFKDESQLTASASAAQSVELTPEVAPSADDKRDTGSDAGSGGDQSLPESPSHGETETSFTKDEIIFRDERILSPDTDMSEVL